MDFTYVASGSISVGDCSPATWAEAIIALYAVNDIVYLRYKAQKGVLERICIKDLRFGKTAYTIDDPYGKKLCQLCNYSPTYLDNLNAYYNEEELCDADTAFELAEDYIILKRNALERFAMTCGKSVT